MEYREIGRTGLSAGIIGLGSEHLDNKPYATVEETIHAALDHGINLMDLFMPGEEVRSNIGRALAGRRDRMMIQGHICSVDLNRQYDISRDLATCRKYFENLLRCLNTDYIDFGMLFFIDSAEDFSSVFESDLLEYAQQLKRKGTIRAIGASSHNPVTARRVVESGVVDLLMFSVNPAFDMMPPETDLETMIGDPAGSMTGMNPVRADLYRLCEQRGVGITVMKTLGAGKLLSREHTPFAEPLTVGQCIHYALTRPAVVSTLIGCQSAAQVAEAVGYLDLSESERDYAGRRQPPQRFQGKLRLLQPLPALPRRNRHRGGQQIPGHRPARRSAHPARHRAALPLSEKARLRLHRLRQLPEAVPLRGAGD